MLTARKIVSPEEQTKVIQAAIDDNDRMVLPTHIVEKNGEIAGAWCLGAVPLVMVWHRSDLKARESLTLNNTIRTVMNDRGGNGYFIACNSHSPYINHMQKFGYEPVWETNIFIGE